jgi:outer membrane protein OmpA-like peptidoglycan-associated protein
MKTPHLILATLVALAAGCARSSADRARSEPAGEERRVDRTSSTQPQPSAQRATDEAPLAVSGIVIDPSIGEVCQIEVAPQTYVEFDPANADVAASPVLEAVTTCLSTGPLKDRKVEIVSHADARSTDDDTREHGRSRAQAVKDYLTTKGISSNQVTTRSHGEPGVAPLTASTPTDLPVERRIDIVLIPAP